MNRSRLFFVLLASLCLTDSGMAFAFPFRDDPQSFTKYMNSVGWRSGDRVTFQNLYNCDTTSGSIANGNDQYSRYRCFGGYVTVTSPKGRQVCDVAYVEWVRDARGSVSWNYSSRNCVFR